MWRRIPQQPAEGGRASPCAELEREAAQRYEDCSGVRAGGPCWCRGACAPTLSVCRGRWYAAALGGDLTLAVPIWAQRCSGCADTPKAESNGGCEHRPRGFHLPKAGPATPHGEGARWDTEAVSHSLPHSQPLSRLPGRVPALSDFLFHVPSPSPVLRVPRPACRVLNTVLPALRPVSPALSPASRATYPTSRPNPNVRAPAVRAMYRTSRPTPQPFVLHPRPASRAPGSAPDPHLPSPAPSHPASPRPTPSAVWPPARPRPARPRSLPPAAGPRRRQPRAGGGAAAAP